MEDELAVELKKMASASPQELVDPDLAKVVAELPAKRKLLEDVTKQVNESSKSLHMYGDNIEALSQQEFIKIFDEFDLSKSVYSS